MSSNDKTYKYVYSFIFSTKDAAKEFKRNMTRIVTLRDLNARYEIGADAEPGHNYGYFMLSDIALLIRPKLLYTIDPRELCFYWKSADSIKIKKPDTAIDEAYYEAALPKPDNLVIDYKAINPYLHSRDDNLLKQEIAKKILREQKENSIINAIDDERSTND